MTQPIHPMLCAMAAKIMEAREGSPCMVKDWDCEERDNPHVAKALRQARAAIQALLEPDEGMNGQCANAYIVASLGEVEDAPRFILQAMLKPLLGG